MKKVFLVQKMSFYILQDWIGRFVFADASTQRLQFSALICRMNDVIVTLKLNLFRSINVILTSRA